ncbi:MAG: uroporphyrinogen decarboxylase family protein, partial [Gaiellaceae bacterium]
AGAEGIFLATVDWGSQHLLSADEYRQWSRPYDLRLLEAARGAPFNVLHVCKGRNLLFEMSDYPVSAFSWDALDPSNPGLAAALQVLSGAVMGGLSFDASLASADPERFTAQYHRALEATGGRRWLAAPGCSIPPGTAAVNLEAVRAASLATRLKETPLS